MRMILLIGGFLGVHALWPYVAADDRLIWAAMLPAAYWAGMWVLFDGRS